MELFSAEFFSALVAIIIIDLVLAGDNAIVIALAARNLPEHLRKKAVVWGTLGAIAVRTSMTLVVVWLLKIPGLLLAGGLLLTWIAYKLVVDNDNGDADHLNPASSFWGAMKTIIVADAVMGLDNVLAVAGAAQGNFMLVVLGLLISIPIVIWGSQIILKYVERYPVIVYIGAGVLAWTSVKMMTGEPLIGAVLAQYPALVWAAYVVIVGGVLLGGMWVNHGKARAHVAAHLVDIASLPAAGPAGEKTDMSKVLIPVDGTANSLKAVRHIINQSMGKQPVEVHLLHVRTPLSQHVARFISGRDRLAYHRDEAEKALQPAREILDKSGIPYTVHIEHGDKAQAINQLAQRLHAGRIVIGTARKNSFTRMIEDSVTSNVLALASVPVEVIAGDSISDLERFGVPAGVGAALVLLFVAVI